MRIWSVSSERLHINTMAAALAAKAVGLLAASCSIGLSARRGYVGMPLHRLYWPAALYGQQP